MSAQAARSKPRRESFGFLARKEPKNPPSQSTLPRHSLSSSFSPKSTARELPTHHQLNRQLSLPCAPPRRSSSLPQNQHQYNQPPFTTISTLANGLGLHFAGEERSTTTSRPSISYQAASTSTRPGQLDEDAGGVVEWMDRLLEDLERVRLGVGRLEVEGGTGRQDEDEREPTKESQSAHDSAQADLSTSSSLSSLIGLFPQPPSSSESTIRATSSDRLRVSISSGRDLPITAEVDASKPPTPPPSPPSNNLPNIIPPSTIITHFSQTPYLPNLTLGLPPLSQAPSSSSLSSSLLLPRTPSPIPCLALPPRRHTSLKHTSSWSFKTRKAAAERKRNEMGLAEEQEKGVEREEEGFVLVGEVRRRESVGGGPFGVGWAEEKAKVFVIDEEEGEGRWVG